MRAEPFDKLRTGLSKSAIWPFDRLRAHQVVLERTCQAVMRTWIEGQLTVAPNARPSRYVAAAAP